MQQVKLGKVLDAITDQTGYSFYYSRPTVNPDEIISLNVKGQPVASVLGLLFKGTKITYRIDGRKVYLTEKVEAKEKPIAHSVSGKVFDEKGKPFPGATVMIKGSQYGVLSSSDGSYTIQARPEDIIVVSCLGYNEKEASVGSKSVLDFTLTEQALMLDDVVVVGYGTQKRSSLSGAVAVVDGKILNARPVVSAANALQGADPSVNITFGTGAPNASTEVNIRGDISINGGSPLILADGVEVSLKSINPNDIESVSILKDAASAVIYGAKASAGVVLITTKSGKEGKTSINYSGRYAVISNTTDNDYITVGYDHVRIVNMFQANSSSASRTALDYTDANNGLQMLYERRKDKVENPDRPWSIADQNGNWMQYGNFDWYNYLFRKHRPQQEHNVSVSGGNDKIKYYASGRYLDQTGIGNNNLTDHYLDYSFRTKLSAKLNKWLTYSNNISYDRSKYTWHGSQSMDKLIEKISLSCGPEFLPFNADGTIVNTCNQNLTSINGLAQGQMGPITSGLFHNSSVDGYLNITNEISINLMKGLTLTGNYTFRNYSGVDKNRTVDYDYSFRKDVIIQSSAFNNTYTVGNTNRNSHVFNAFGTYENGWDKHSFKATFGWQYEDYRSETVNSQKGSLLQDNLDSFSVAAADALTSITDSFSTFATEGYFLRLNYDFDGKYILEACGRADGTSRFKQSGRWGYFPSASAAWRFSKEQFFIPMKSWWSNGKARLSFGSLGNQQVGNYSYLRTINTNNSQSYTFDGANISKYATASAPVASDLTWETVSTYDLGLDLGFFNDRLTLESDYYIRDTKNMLTNSVELPSVYGAAEPEANCANLRTRGYEISLRWKNELSIAGHPFNYSIVGSIGDRITKITKFFNPTNSISSNYVGKTLGEIWGYRMDGIFQTDEEAADYQKKIDSSYLNNGIFLGSSSLGNYLQAGDVNVRDLNGDGKITAGKGTLEDHGDREIIGNSLPRYNYSFRVECDWNGIDFSAFFQGIGHQDWYPSSSYWSLDFWGPYVWPNTSFISKDFMSKVWTKENTDAYFPVARGYYARSTDNLKGSLGFANDRYLQNVGYLRLKNLTVGYTLPQKYTKMIGVERLRLFFTGENLFYLSALKKHCKTIDPELASGSGTNTSNTGVGYAYPKTISCGIDINF